MLVGLPYYPALTAEDAETSASVIFERANAAYDRGDYPEAVKQYEDLFNRGYATVETFYNAANATFRSGSAGEAVLLYRRAWYLNPRDADVLANIQLALQRTGALQPTMSYLDHAAGELSHREWAMVLKMSYWIAAAAFALMVMMPSMRRFLKPVAVIGCVASILGLSGWFYWYRWQVSGEAVMTAENQTALYEPREKATPFFSIPEGSIVYIEDSFDSWAKVRAGQNAGWVSKTSVTPVYPWKNAEID